MMDRTSAMILQSDAAMLVVIDFQERLVAAMPQPVVRQAIHNVVNLVSCFYGLGAPCLMTEQYPRGLGPTVVPIMDAVEALEPVAKLDFDATEEPEFMSILRQSSSRRQIVLTGMETHICVYQTARSLVQQGYTVHVPVDAVVSRTKANWRGGLSLMERSGALLTTTESVIFDLLKRGEGELFKEMSRRVR